MRREAARTGRAGGSKPVTDTKSWSEEQIELAALKVRQPRGLPAALPARCVRTVPLRNLPLTNDERRRRGPAGNRREYEAKLKDELTKLGVAAGELVAVDPARPCGACEWCGRGHVNLCPSVRFTGAPPFDGALTERLHVSREQVVPLPTGFNPIPAATLEPATKESDPETYEDSWARVRAVDGILCPGGFGDRGVEGKVLTANYARVNKVPFLGICLGFQVGVIEFARSVLGLENAHSAEFDEALECPTRTRPTAHRAVPSRGLARQLLTSAPVRHRRRRTRWSCSCPRCRAHRWAGPCASAPVARCSVPRSASLRACTAASRRSTSATATATRSTSTR